MKEDRVYLLHIRDALQCIRDYTQAGEKAFFSDRKTQDAVLRNFEIIGEAVKHLSADLKNRYPGVPWKRVAGMRDKVIHDYFGVNLKLVWETIRGSLVDFERHIHSILQSSSAEK